jgi:hypothetical protein
MTQFKITQDVFFGQPPESTSPFLEVPDLSKQHPQSVSLFPLSARVLKNTLNPNTVLHGHVST